MDVTTPAEAEHAKAIETLERVTTRLQDAMGQVATKEDVQRLETKIDTGLAKALDSAPPWAVREIGWLRMGVGAAITGAFIAAFDALKRHLGVIG